MEKIDPKRELEIWEECKKAALCPLPREARLALFLSVKQFCELVGISRGDYFEMEHGSKQLSHDQRLFIVEAIRIARERGLIPDRRF